MNTISRLLKAISFSLYLRIAPSICFHHLRIKNRVQKNKIENLEVDLNPHRNLALSKNVLLQIDGIGEKNGFFNN